MDTANLLFNNFGKVIALVVALTLAVIAMFKINIKFDLNEFLKARKQRSAKKAQHYCPHMEFKTADDGVMVISWFESPPGTIAWICRSCQKVVNNVDREQQEEDSEYWLKNPKAYKKTLRKYNRHAKKSI